MVQSIKNTNSSSGQVALVMVLIMSVVSAVVVSVAGRVTTETRIQQLSKDSGDAFLTAQSGLEEAISRQESIDSTAVGDDRTYRVLLDNLGQDGLLTDVVSPGSSMDVVFNASASLQGIIVYWESTTSSPSAVFLSKIMDSEIEDLAYDTLGANGFTRVLTGGTLNGTNFSYVTPQINLDPTVRRLRVTLYGGPARLGFQPVGDLLPVQLVSYNSEGTVGVGGESVRYGLSFEQSLSKRVPEVFDYALFSFGSIVQ